MINKFEKHEADLPEDDPRPRIISAWELFGSLFRQNYRTVMTLIGDINELSLFEKRDDPEFNYAVELEATLQRECPELVGAIDGLRTALDKVTGWRIDWRLHARGEAIGTKEETIDEGLVIARAVRGPDQFHPMGGWVISSQVGADRVMGGLGAWVEVGFTKEDTRGASFELSQMFAIELTPPDSPA